MRLTAAKTCRPVLQHVRPRPIQRALLSAYTKPPFTNEPAKDYAKGSPERSELTAAIADMKKSFPVQIPLPLSKQRGGAQDIKQHNPSLHKEVVANWQPATAQNVQQAIDSALKAKTSWEEMSLKDRAAIFLRAADLVSTKYRYELVAATMLGQGKNIWQGEIDAGQEVCDLIRYYVQCAFNLHAQQPAINAPGTWNRQEYRPLEGFVYAISPFNFTALGTNLAFGPALMGNVVLWKPSNYSLHASWLLYNIFLEAGVPPDVVQWVPGDAVEVTKACLSHREFAGLSFTGSTEVFKSLLGQVGQGTAQNLYRQIPRVVGETGGKNFHLIHHSADVDNAVNHTIRGAFEYQGQKCSATSRVYVPQSMWPDFREKIVSRIKELKVGSPEQYDNFVNSVIHEASFDKLAGVLSQAESDPGLTLLVGGQASKKDGYFVHPTLYQVSDPHHELMHRELFGPIAMIYVYPDAEWEQIVQTVDQTSEYGLTGSVFGRDQAAIEYAERGLRNAAGNLYINVKCTGSMIGQQPFGGSRASGTNDKVGSVNVISRFVSVRTITDSSRTLEEVVYPSNEI
ncbi:hypothetical protein ASPVEDRAFT_886979 [Aspergillus versicolor CBS 583.65]|uniref:Multifunctional fusion protein n=1 Tax=Aspergillus versicolor CBS 583.65 TaxID=1036611 RepID=A0A1L9PJH7_ASPVE|nr:uncharacterized protein ASPVEDRAFT_886979 [Aspergillus versicolor CBS 583.65]OJJ01687.1 hypothetical protein ASPVEDRAFT_886979 [Aspergillus versicolor CBS 583.65]